MMNEELEKSREVVHEGLADNYILLTNLSRVEPRLAPVLDLNLDDFKQDIRKLVDRAQELHRVKERCKAQLVSLQNHQPLIESEIEITAKAVQEQTGFTVLVPSLTFRRLFESARVASLPAGP